MVAGAVTFSACATATQVTVDVTTDIPYAVSRKVGIWASRPGAAEKNEPAAALADTIWSADGRIGTIVVAPQGDRTAPFAVRVVMGISKPAEQCSVDAPEGCVIARRHLRFITGRGLKLPIRL